MLVVYLFVLDVGFGYLFVVRLLLVLCGDDLLCWSVVFGLLLTFGLLLDCLLDCVMVVGLWVVLLLGGLFSWMFDYFALFIYFVFVLFCFGIYLDVVRFWFSTWLLSCLILYVMLRVRFDYVVLVIVLYWFFGFW